MNLAAAAGPAAAFLRSLPSEAALLVLAHYDVDGVASAAVAARTLERAGRRFHIRFSHEHDPRAYDALRLEPAAAFLFLDLGAALLPTLAELDRPVLVLDHHPMPTGKPPSGRVQVLNPLDHGLDGMTDACGSTTTLAWALAIDDRNWDLAPHALVGAFADRQADGGLRGWNAHILEEAVRRGHVALRPRLAFEDAPLLDFLAHAPADLPGRPPPGYEAADAFLRGLGLPLDATVHELSEKEQEHLASALALRHLRAGKPADAVGRLISPQPVSKPHGLPLARLVTLLDAATRQSEAGLALAFLLGDASARSELEGLEIRFHQRIRENLQRLEREPPKEHRRLRSFPVEDVALTGTLCGLAMDKILSSDKATLVHARVDPRAVISARATKDLLVRGLNLSSALEQAAHEVGGVGGGHPIASGANIPAERLDDFLEHVDRLLDAQWREVIA